MKGLHSSKNIFMRNTMQMTYSDRYVFLIKNFHNSFFIGIKEYNVSIQVGILYKGVVQSAPRRFFKNRLAEQS